MPLRSVVPALGLFAIGLAGIVTAVRAASPEMGLGVGAAVGLCLVVSGVIARRKALSRSMTISAIESVTATHMGLIWIWGACAIITVYPLMMHWREWPHFFGAFLAAGLISLAYARLLARDAEAGRDDATLLQLGRYLATGQLVGMAITLVGLILDPDKELLYIKEVDWAGNGIFFTGALALLLITAEALFISRTSLPAPKAP